MATNFAIVNVIYRKNHFVAQDPELNWAEINCSRISAFTPRPAWLLREKYTDGRILYHLTFTESSDTNALKGFWIEQDGEGMLIDVKEVNGKPVSLAEYCKSCCDASPIPVIDTEYDWNDLSVFNYSHSSRASYCIFRPNIDGDLIDVQQVVMDYTGNVEDIKVSSVSGSPKGVYFNGQSYETPRPVGSDVITSGECGG